MHKSKRPACRNFYCYQYHCVLYCKYFYFNWEIHRYSLNVGMKSRFLNSWFRDRIDLEEVVPVKTAYETRIDSRWQFLSSSDILVPWNDDLSCHFRNIVIHNKADQRQGIFKLLSWFSAVMQFTFFYMSLYCFHFKTKHVLWYCLLVAWNINSLYSLANGKGYSNGSNGFSTWAG